MKTGFGRCYMKSYKIKRISKILLFSLLTIIALTPFVLFARYVSRLQINSYYSEKINEDDLVWYDINIVHQSFEHIDGSPEMVSSSNYSHDLILDVARSGFIFPKNLFADEQISFFFFYEKHNGDGGQVYRSEIFLKRQLNKEDYEAEIIRLQSIESYGKKAIYVDDLFSLPSFVASYNMFSSFEYALLDYTSMEIIYVYLYSIGSSDEIVFDNELAPSKRLNESSFPKDLITTDGAYSMYWSY